MNQNPEIEKLNKKAKEYSKMLQGIHAEMSKVIVGQDAVIENLILALATQGHVLLKGVPGLAKTLLIKTLADCIDLDFVRLQFTPDLLPADIIGTKIYDHTTSFKTVRGPIFSNFVLVDEINRAPPKVQSALLEAMQEQQSAYKVRRIKLIFRIFVMATQNCNLEMEGTYNLPDSAFGHGLCYAI